MSDDLRISSPKRSRHGQTGWEGFFPYYAGFSEFFARELILSSGLTPGSLIYDPWNGSGTTTYAATTLDMSSIGFDLNPVMAIIAKARLLSPSEADSIASLGEKIVAHARTISGSATADPLRAWSGSGNADTLRSLECSIREHLVGAMTIADKGINFDHLSCLASTNYVALFSICRALAASFRSTNPKCGFGAPDLKRRNLAIQTSQFGINILKRCGEWPPRCKNASQLQVQRLLLRRFELLIRLRFLLRPIA